MKLPLRPESGLLGLYAGVYLVFHLAASYLGGVFKPVSRFLLILLFLDLVHLFWNYRQLRYSQNFSTTHPVKGQKVDYLLRIRLESPFPGARLLVRFKGILADLRLEEGATELDFFPARDILEEHSKQIQCPFRGNYTVGLDSMELQDALGLIWLKVPVWYISFYVSPRLIHLDSCRLSAEGRQVLPSSVADGLLVDPTRFRSLSEYRPGASVRHLAWKKFAATGVPFLKDWERSALPGLTLYLDTLRPKQPDYQALVDEDCALEIVLALAYWFVRQDIPVYFRRDDGLARLEYGIEGFPGFMETTSRLAFRTGSAAGLPSLIRDLESDLRIGSLDTVAVAGIFRRFDSDVIAFLEDYRDEYRHFYALVVASALSAEAHAQAMRYRNLASRGDHLVLVRSSESIKEDLA